MTPSLCACTYPPPCPRPDLPPLRSLLPPCRTTPSSAGNHSWVLQSCHPVISRMSLTFRDWLFFTEPPSLETPPGHCCINRAQGEDGPSPAVHRLKDPGRAPSWAAVNPLRGHLWTEFVGRQIPTSRGGCPRVSPGPSVGARLVLFFKESAHMFSASAPHLRSRAGGARPGLPASVAASSSSHPDGCGRRLHFPDASRR